MKPVQKPIEPMKPVQITQIRALPTQGFKFNPVIINPCRIFNDIP